MCRLKTDQTELPEQSLEVVLSCCLHKWKLWSMHCGSWHQPGAHPATLCCPHQQDMKIIYQLPSWAKQPQMQRKCLEHLLPLFLLWQWCLQDCFWHFFLLTPFSAIWYFVLSKRHFPRGISSWQAQLCPLVGPLELAGTSCLECGEAPDIFSQRPPIQPLPNLATCTQYIHIFRKKW